MAEKKKLPALAQRKSRHWLVQNLQPTPRSSTQRRPSPGLASADPNAQCARIISGELMRPARHAVTQIAMARIRSLAMGSTRQERRLPTPTPGRATSRASRPQEFLARRSRGTLSLLDGEMMSTSLLLASIASSHTASRESWTLQPIH